MLRKIAGRGLVAVAAVFGLIVAIRMLVGPFDFPVRVRIPLNPEGWFGLGLVAALLAAGRGGDFSAQEPGGGQWRIGVIAALIGLILITFWRALDFYFLSDDFTLVRLAGDFHFARQFTTPGGDGFFRPLGNISLALTSIWSGANPAAWHATALVLHAANVVLVLLLASRLCASRLAAFFAGALFAIHGTRPEAAAWIAGRFDLLATFFVLLGLVFFIRAHGEESSIGYLYDMAALVAMVLAILSKESAYIFPLLLVLFLIAKRDLSRGRDALTPFFVMAAALFAYRLWLFGGIGGYRDGQSGEPQALTFGLATLKALGLRIWTALFFPINWSTEPGRLLAALTIAYIAALIWLTGGRPVRTRIAFGLGFVVVAVIPPLHLLVIGPDLGNSRLLYLPSVGFCLLLAAAIDGLKERSRWVAACTILAFHAAAVHHNLNAWQYASDKARSACAVAVKCLGSRTENITDSPLPGSLRGVPFFANGLQDCLELHRGACGAARREPICQPSAERRDGRRRFVLVWDDRAAEARCAEQ